jgi:hypothetical protein
MDQLALKYLNYVFELIKISKWDRKSWKMESDDSKL